MTKPKLKALVPKSPGHQFVFYGDSCSGVPGGRHEEPHARINTVVARLDPSPAFIIFPGDEIVGLVPDEASLREQWRFWFDVEMAWLDRSRTPLYHSTGNHTTYDRMSERVFADTLSHLPRNGPADQLGLAYFVRKKELLLVFIHSMINAIWFGAMVVLLARLSSLARSRSFQRWLKGVTGVVFLGFGAKLATYRPNL